jgi:hypothetical protein
VSGRKKTYDFTDEKLVFESRELVAKLAAGGRLHWLWQRRCLPACLPACLPLFLLSSSLPSCPALLFLPPCYPAAPHRGDLAVNVALGITLLWLPLSIAGE